MVSRWKAKEREIHGEERKALSFLASERNRIRKSVLQKADLWQPSRTKYTVPNAHPLLRSWIHRAQWELWRWEACLSVLFWTSRVEAAWQQVFADDEFRAQTNVNWRAFFDIPNPVETAHVVGTLNYSHDWFENLKQGPLAGALLRNELWKHSPPDVRDSIRAKMQEDYGGGSCGLWYVRFFQGADDMWKLEERARQYLDDDRERDVLEEEQIAKEAENLTDTMGTCLTMLFECEEMNKVIYGKFAVESVRPGSAINNVVRLADSNPQTKTTENSVLLAVSRIPKTGRTSVETGDVIPLADKETTSPSPPQQTSSTERVEKSDKKTGQVEVKKSESDEKRKDETGTGVENS